MIEEGISVATFGSGSVPALVRDAMTCTRDVSILTRRLVAKLNHRVPCAAVKRPKTQRLLAGGCRLCMDRPLIFMQLNECTLLLYISGTRML